MVKGYKIVDGKLVEVELGPDWWKPKEEPDQQFYEVVWERPSVLYPERLTDRIVCTPSDEHTQYPVHNCHVGVDVCARVPADSEEEAEKIFLKWYSWSDTVDR